MTESQIEQRAQRAVELFKQGFNCSQAVFASCADLYGLDEKMALRLSSSFGGGMGRMHLVCGAASGMFMLAGLHNGSSTPHDHDGKMANYALVKDLGQQTTLRRHGRPIRPHLPRYYRLVAPFPLLSTPRRYYRLVAPFPLLSTPRRYPGEFDYVLD